MEASCQLPSIVFRIMMHAFERRSGGIHHLTLAGGVQRLAELQGHHSCRHTRVDTLVSNTVDPLVSTHTMCHHIKSVRRR